MTTDEAGLLIATLAAAYPRQQLEPATIEIYARSLVDLDIDLATSAVARLIASAKFFPTIAEIRAMAGELAVGLPTPTEAWSAILAALAGTSSFGSLPDEVREAVRAVGGSYAIRTSENPTALRSQFRGYYEDIRSRRIDEVLFAGTPQIEPRRQHAIEQ